MNADIESGDNLAIGFFQRMAIERKPISAS